MSVCKHTCVGRSHLGALSIDEPMNQSIVWSIPSRTHETGHVTVDATACAPTIATRPTTARWSCVFSCGFSSTIDLRRQMRQIERPNGVPREGGSGTHPLRDEPPIVALDIVGKRVRAADEMRRYSEGACSLPVRHGARSVGSPLGMPPVRVVSFVGRLGDSA